MELGPPNDLRLQAAFVAVWTNPDLEGIFLQRNQDPEDQRRFSLSQVEPLQIARGVARLPGGLLVPCYTDVVRGEGGSDWLNLSLPTGALRRACSGAAFDTSERWLEDWLVDIGRRVYDRVPFELGLIGWMVGGQSSAAEIREAGIPDKRYMAYLRPEAASVIYLPRTEPHLDRFY